MSRFFTGLCVALAVMAAPLSASARDQASERLDLAYRFVALMQVEDMAKAMEASFVDLFPATTGMDPEEPRAVQDTMSEMMQEYMPALFKAMAPVYAEIFTLEELRALVAFYESDVGRSMVRKSYEAAPRVAVVAQTVLPPILERAMNRLCDRLECSAEERQNMKSALKGQGGQAAPAK